MQFSFWTCALPSHPTNSYVKSERHLLTLHAKIRMKWHSKTPFRNTLFVSKWSCSWLLSTIESIKLNQPCLTSCSLSFCAYFNRPSRDCTWLRKSCNSLSFLFSAFRSCNWVLYWSLFRFSWSICFVSHLFAFRWISLKFGSIKTLNQSRYKTELFS